MQQPLEQDIKSEVLRRSQLALTRMRDYRLQYDAKRIAWYRQWIGQRNQILYPDNVTPRSNIFIPYPFSNVETIIGRTDDALFSIKEWFECRGNTAEDGPAAEAMTAVLRDRVHKANFPIVAEEASRNAAIYGHCAVAVEWDWDYDLVPFKQGIFVDMAGNRTPQFTQVPDPTTGAPVPINPQSGVPIVIDPQTGQPAVVQVIPDFKKVPRMRPKYTAVDIFDLLIDPISSRVARMSEKTLGSLIREQETYAEANPESPYLYDPETLAILGQRIKDQSTDPESVLVRLAQLWDVPTNTCTLLAYGQDSEALRWKDTRASLRGAHYNYYKGREVYGGENLVLWHGPNPYSHCRVPIVHCPFTRVANEVYGIGAIEPIAELTEGLNKITNMITDNWNMGVNRRYIYSTDADIDHEALNFLNVPGGKVGAKGDAAKAVFPLPTMTPTSGDYEIIPLYRGVIEMASGISDFYSKGTGGGGSNSTATGISSIINESNYRFKLFIRNFEIQILTPVLEMSAAMIQQYITDGLEVAITGENPVIPKFVFITPEQLIGNFHYDLVASNYATNKVVRQRTLLEFMNYAAQTPYWNAYEGLKELGKVFEIQNYKRLLYTPDQVAMQQQAQEAKQIQMMLLEGMIDTEKKSRLADHKAVINQNAKATAERGGRPKMHPGGTLPGAGLTSGIRSLAQNITMGNTGLGGMGEAGAGMGR